MRTLLIALGCGVGRDVHRQRGHHRVPAPGPRPPGAHAVGTGALQVFRFLTWITTGIRPRQWVAVHRKHHAFTDVEGDPHSPVLLGWVRTCRSTTSPCTAARRATPRPWRKYAKDLPPRPLGPVLFDHALLGLGIGIGAARAGVRPGGRPARRVRPRQPVPRRLGRGERDRPPLRPPAVPQRRRQPAVARLPHRRRGPAQQPPRRARRRPSSPTAGTRSTRAGT